MTSKMVEVAKFGRLSEGGLVLKKSTAPRHDGLQPSLHRHQGETANSFSIAALE
jgi:hypothetical protein